MEEHGKFITTPGKGDKNPLVRVAGSEKWGNHHMGRGGPFQVRYSKEPQQVAGGGGGGGVSLNVMPGIEEGGLIRPRRMTVSGRRRSTSGLRGKCAPTYRRQD